MIRPSCRRRERLRTSGVGASSPASRVTRKTRLPDVWMPRWARRARSFLWPSPTNGESAITWRIASSSASSVIAPSGPGRRWGCGGAVGSEMLRRRRCSHAADLDTPAIRQTRTGRASSRLATFSASATEGGPRPPPAAPWRCRGPSPAPDLALRVSELAVLHRACLVFKPSCPAIRKSSRHPAITPAACPVSRASASRPSPRSNLRTTSCLRRALQRTSRPPSGRPLAAPERDPACWPIGPSMTPDIIDLRRSNRVSGQNLVPSEVALIKAMFRDPDRNRFR